MNIYLGNLPFNATEDELRNAFSEFGEISSVKVITDRFSGRSKGFGFIEMPNNSEADKAVKAFSKVPLRLHGQSIKVNQAEKTRKRKKRGRRRY